MVVNRLYYDYNNPRSSASFDFSDETLARALENIYYHDFDIAGNVEPNLFREVLSALNTAVDEGIRLSPDPDVDFIDALRHSAEVFSAFKVHRFQNDMARAMIGSDGNLKPFEQWLKDIQPIASHQVGSWLRTEYDTAVIRAHQAADWNQFLRDRDVLPNLKWMPSTSAVPGEDHRVFWGVIRPVDDPFWAHHRPGDRWNCKCSLSSTDEPETSAPGVASPADNPQPGLSSNPGTDRQIFSDDHPYFPDNCASCPFARKSFKARLETLFFNRAKDCYNCRFINNCIERESEKKLIQKKVFLKREYVKTNDLMPKRDKIPCHSVVSGELNCTYKVRNTLLKHCHHDYDVDAAEYIWNHPDELSFIRESHLGEGKDMSSPKDEANIRKKKKVLGFVKFMIYKFTFRGKTFLVKLALHKNGYEQFYALYEK